MKKFSLPFTGFLVTIMLSGCIIERPRPVVYATPPAPMQQAVVVDVAPPEPQAEIVGVAPAGMFWLAGAWFWEGGRHVWHPGHWEAHRQGQLWVPHQWVRVGNAWHFREGHWARR